MFLNFEGGAGDLYTAVHMQSLDSQHTGVCFSVLTLPTELRSFSYYGDTYTLVFIGALFTFVRKWDQS